MASLRRNLGLPALAVALVAAASLGAVRALGQAQRGAGEAEIRSEADSVGRVAEALREALDRRLLVAQELSDDKLVVKAAKSRADAARVQIARLLDARWVRPPDSSGGALRLEPSPARADIIASAERARELARSNEIQLVVDRIRSAFDDPSKRWDPKGLFPQTEPAFEILRTLSADSLELALSRPAPPGRRGGARSAPAQSVAYPVGRLSPETRQAVRHYVEALAEFSAGDAEHSAWLRRYVDRADELWLRLPAFRAISDPTVPEGLDGEASIVLWDPRRNGALGIPLTLRAYTLLNHTLGDTAASGETPEQLRGRKVKIESGSYRFDRFLTMLADAGEFNVVSDYFTRSKLVQLTKPEYDLDELLTGVDENMGVRHWWDGDTLLVRTRNWPDALAVEPTQAMVETLERTARTEGGFTFEEYLELAADATDDQIATLQLHTGPQGETPWKAWADRLRANAIWLRAYASLSNRERDQARREAGLRLERLDPTKRALWNEVLLRNALYIPGQPAPVTLHVSGERDAIFPGMVPVPRAWLTSPLAAQPAQLWLR